MAVDTLIILAVKRERLYSEDPSERLLAARSLRGSQRKKVLAAAGLHWPSFSPGSANAWLLLVTSKPPSWSHPLLQWTEGPPVLGEPHSGFFYPDPLGFWDEVRRWVALLVGSTQSGWGAPEALAVSALVHTTSQGGASLPAIVGTIRPRLMLFLDEAAWKASALPLMRSPQHHHIADPHRQGQFYEGFWGHLAGGAVVGKSPQHPTTHRLYRPADMAEFLGAAPAPRAPSNRASAPGSR